MRKIPHVSISGYAGAGKTTVSLLLASKHKTLWIPRVTSRPRRWSKNNPHLSEVHGHEYFFCNPSDFSLMQFRGEFLGYTEHSVVVGGRVYRTAIQRPEFWPKPSLDTELMLSTFGSAAPKVKRYDAPDLITILLKAPSNEELRRRLIDRKIGKSSLSFHMSTNKRYEEGNLEKDFDYVIVNDVLKKTVEIIEEIAGLPHRLTHAHSPA